MAAPAANQSSTVVADTAVLLLMVKNVATKKVPSRCPIAHLRVATDCSGLHVPMAVFEELDIATDHVFSSECNQTLHMKSRNNHIPCPEETDSDVYAAGLPCQPFNKSGKNLGVTWGD